MQQELQHAAGVDWTQVLLALVTTVGTVATAFVYALFASKAKAHQKEMGKLVSRTEEAANVIVTSLRPPSPSNRPPSDPPPTLR